MVRRGQSGRAVEDLQGNRVRKSLFGSCSSKGTADFMRFDTAVQHLERRASNARGVRKRKAREGGDATERTRNEKVPLEKGFLDAKLVDILKTCPDRDEEVLRSLGYEDLIQQGMTNVFRVSYVFFFFF